MRHLFFFVSGNIPDRLSILRPFFKHYEHRIDKFHPIVYGNEMERSMATSLVHRHIPQDAYVHQLDSGLNPEFTSKLKEKVWGQRILAELEEHDLHVCCDQDEFISLPGDRSIDQAIKQGRVAYLMSDLADRFTIDGKMEYISEVKDIFTQFPIRASYRAQTKVILAPRRLLPNGGNHYPENQTDQDRWRRIYYPGLVNHFKWYLPFDGYDKVRQTQNENEGWQATHDYDKGAMGPNFTFDISKLDLL